MPAPDFSLCLFLIPEQVVWFLFSHLLLLSFAWIWSWNLLDSLKLKKLKVHHSPSEYHLIPFEFSFFVILKMCMHFYCCQQLEEQFKTLIVLSHYLEVWIYLSFSSWLCFSESNWMLYLICAENYRLPDFASFGMKLQKIAAYLKLFQVFHLSHVNYFFVLETSSLKFIFGNHFFLLYFVVDICKSEHDYFANVNIEVSL